MSKFQVGERISHYDETIDGMVVEIKSFNQISEKSTNPYEFEDFDEEARSLSWYVVDWDDGIRSTEIESILVTLRD